MKIKKILLKAIIIALVIVSSYIDYKVITSDAPTWAKYVWLTK